MFMNPDRVTNADIDTDYSEKDKEKVEEYLLRDHMEIDGLQCAKIITFNTIATKGAIKDIGRALNMEVWETQEISNQVYLDENKKWVAPESVRKEYPELFKYVDIVAGTIVSIGAHPSGIVVSDLDIAKTIGLTTLSSSPYPVTSLNMKELDDLMYVKLDILGLDNIGLINETCKMVGIERLNPDNTDLDDSNVWKSIRDDTTMIFQWESRSAQAYLRELMSDSTLDKVRKNVKDFSMIKWLSFGNGLIRPSCASFRNDVSKGNFYDNGLDVLNEFLAPTLGRIVMQEDIMRWLKEFCGYNDAEADIVRRCLDENTIIKMGDNTLKKISDINVGDYVMSYNKYGASEPKIVNNVFDNGIQECFELKAQHGYSIIGTAEHKILTQNGYVKIKDISLDDYIMVPTKLNCIDDNLRPNQRLSCSDMFLLGCLIGDGSIGESRLNFINSDKSLINKYKECVNSRIRNSMLCEFGESYQDGISVDRIYTVTIKPKNYKDSVKNLLARYNLLNTLSGDKYIHEDLMKYPIGSKLTSLLGGLFSTDGGYNVQGNYIDYSSKSYMLVKNIKDLLLKFGIYSYISVTNIPEYNYPFYRVIIAQDNSLDIFGEKILPYVVGYKQQKFYDIIHKKSKLSYNYLLPDKFTKEISSNLEDTHRSLRSTEVDKISKGGKITDKKAKKIVEKVYCPETYKILMADYIPVKVKEIIPVGKRHVFDLEVEDNHNYIANDIIVHNCIAKKKGTDKLLIEIKERFIDYSVSHFGIAEEKAKSAIEPFLRVIHDASSYAFSWNHSDPYSCIGYICGYLRYYYPLEFITAALNIFSSNEEKTNSIIQYANKQGFNIRNIKYGYSKAEYFYDKETNSIYKGVASVKFMNAQLGDALYEMSKKYYDSFVDLLFEIRRNKVADSGQLNALIQLDYFSNFGNAAELMRIKAIVENLKYGDAKSYSKSKVPEDSFLYPLFEKYGNGVNKDGSPSKSYNNLDCRKILLGAEKAIKEQHTEDYSISQKMAIQQKFLGYIALVTEKEEDRPKLYVEKVVDAKVKATGKVFGKRIFCRSIGSGKESMFTIAIEGRFDRQTKRRLESTWERCGKVKEGYIIYVKKYKKNKAKDGKVYYDLVDYDIMIE